MDGFLTPPKADFAQLASILGVFKVHWVWTNWPTGWIGFEGCVESIDGLAALKCWFACLNYQLSLVPLPRMSFFSLFVAWITLEEDLKYKKNHLRSYSLDNNSYCPLQRICPQMYFLHGSLQPLIPLLQKKISLYYLPLDTDETKWPIWSSSGFSTQHLRAGWFLLWGRPVHHRMISGTPGLRPPLPVHPYSSCDGQKRLRTLPDVSWGWETWQNCPSWGPLVYFFVSEENKWWEWNPMV